ncbi:MAG: preprotein translocase subunit SecG [Sterolibacteriaceae bacterium MAG5]|nr:preprotein translocase subunit SecG [Candidatus Nitricoxidireducens bremensis]
MDFIYSTTLTVHILVGLAVIALVLVQHGKGADMGAAFGSGSSGSLFGATGSANFLSRTTAALAAVFFLTSLGLSYMAGSRTQVSGSVVDAAVQSAPAETLPAKPELPLPTGVPDSKARDIPK